jgi:hypothetical protein
MSDEQKESRIKVEDLPKEEQELTTEEAKEVKGGTEGRTRLIIGDDQGVYGNNDDVTDIIVGAGPGSPGGHVK